MTITPTMTACETTTAVRPSRPPGDAQTARNAAPVAPRRLGPAPSPPRRRASSNGSGLQQRQDGEGDDGEHHRGDRERTTERRKAERAPEVGTRSGEVGAEHRADRRRPDHEGQVPAPAIGGGEVGGGVARLQAAGGGGTEGEEPDQEQRQGGDGRGNHGHHGTEDRDGVAGGETRPAPGPVADPRQRDGDGGRAEHRHGLSQPRRAVGACDVAGEQSAHGDTHGHAQTGEGDTPAEHADGAALDDEGIDVRGNGHSPMERPMISFMISFVPP
jgi:hypothetical protein